MTQKSRTLQNCINKRPRENSIVFKGVCFYKGKFIAFLSKDGKHILYKKFNNLKEAVIEYNRVVKEVYGEHDHLNDIGKLGNVR